MVDPVSGEGRGEDGEGGLVGFGDYVGVVGVTSPSEGCVYASAVGWGVDVEEGGVDGASLVGVAGLRVTELEMLAYVIGREADAPGGPGDSEGAVLVDVGDGPVVAVLDRLLTMRFRSVRRRRWFRRVTTSSPTNSTEFPTLHAVVLVSSSPEVIRDC